MLNQHDIKGHIRSVLRGFFLQVKKDKQAINRDVDLTTEIGMYHLNLTLNRTNALQQETTVFF
ncbi:hypothetical protein [Bacillus atrophaeus]|uniref:hypothetical protein n=1 Tax=Bacillus atrophaeus TaxID=1452 RepID=UPI0038738E2D